MRLVPTFCLREGMILGKSIYNRNGSLLLREGTDITLNYIDKVVDLNIQGLYIDDDLSKDIEVESVISDELRLSAVSKIKDIFIDIEKSSQNIEQNVAIAGSLVEDMIDALLGNRDVMVNMVDIKSFDEYTYHHSVNVCVLSVIVGISLDLNKEDLQNLGMSALLHDIGKVFIPQDLLNKVERLTDEEFELMKEHSFDGYKYIKDTFNFPVPTYIGILQHHEKYDGTGYPHGRKGENISLFARIIAIADVYDALVSNRPYKQALLPSEAMEFIMGGAGTHFEFDLINLFIKKVAAYPLGTCVKLSNGQIGIVIENFPDASTRPKVRVIDPESDEYIYINLKDDFNHNNITIQEIVNI